MPKYYCHECAAKLGHLQSVYTSDPLGSTYQLDKYIKHTVPDPKYEVQSVLFPASTQAYGDFIVSSAASGAVEYDDRGRRNIIVVAGKVVGFRFERGKQVQPQDAIKLVLSSETHKVHLYPENSTSFTTQFCSECGRPIVT